MPVQTKLEPMTNRDLFSNYYLENLLPESDTWKSAEEEKIRQVFEDIKEIYDDHKDYIETYKEDHLEDKFIRPIFKELGFEYGTREAVEKRQRFPDYGLFKSDEELKKAYDKKEEEDFYKNAISIAEAKRWDRNLDKRGGVRDFTNPSHQVYVYLQETPVDWAILTNGRKWRIYYSKTSHKLDSYYEIDLPSVLEKEDLELFKYFYLLFRSEAFVEDKRGECFLDKVYDKSNLFSQELGEDLKGNIYEAIRLLAEGFLDFSENELDPEEDLELIHDSSLIYLYRLIFVLYAESEGRDLLDTSNRLYNEHYSLNNLKQEVCENLEKGENKYTGWRAEIWDDLEELFELIDKGSKSKGIPEDDLFIPAYNGGLFKTEVTEETSDEAEFLQEHKVADSYLAEVIDLLTRHESQNGEGRVFVDYSSLDIRHLGSIYEGLLEYHLNVASESMVAVKEDKEEKWYPEKDYEGEGNVVEELEEGEVYLTTDKGERKATGSYYTPEYIVQYIVENTLDPILDEIREDLLRKGMGNFAHRFAERVFELKVLDPAMGSGHFLTNAVDHLAREIVNAHEKQAEEEGAETVDESHDIHWARRQVAQKCIYGVDLNSMAVELAKVSLWLRTLAAQKPLAFLDHHLKTGNSLIGSDIEEIEELDSGKKEESEVNSTTLEDFGMTKKGTMEDLMRIYQDFIKIENQDLEDIKEMEEKYHEFEHEPIRERLEAMANVHTAREFDVDVPESSFGKMAQAIDDDGKWEEIEEEDWFEEAQEMAGDKEFFHWKLAFPEVFYEEEGEKKEDAGFDVVMGNPPYVKTHNLPEFYRNYSNKTFEIVSNTDQPDIYQGFIEKSIEISNHNNLSFIVPTLFYNGDQYTYFRRKLLEYGISKIVDCGDGVFEGVGMPTGIIKFDDESSSFDVFVRTSDRFQFKKTTSYEFVRQNPSFQFAVFSDSKSENVIQKLNKIQTKIEDKFEWIRGLELGKSSDLLSESQTDNHDKRILTGEDVERYAVTSEKWLNSDKADLKKEKYFKDDKILVRETGKRITALVEKKNRYTTRSLYNFIKSGYESKLEVAVAQLNSSLFQFYYKSLFKTRTQLFPKIRINQATTLPILEGNEEISLKVEQISKKKEEKRSLNLHIKDYLGHYSDGTSLEGIYNPIEGVSETILTDTAADLEKLQIGSIGFEENDNELILKASARYKPENEEDFTEDELDRWGYTETELIPVMKFTGDEMELALIQEFTKLAVDEASGFANFRESATKTMSILDRLEKLTLPKLSDVESGLEKYLEQKEKAERLEEEIRETDHTIDAIVFDLYDLIEEEVETVLDSLDTNEEEKMDIMEKFKAMEKE